MMDEMHAFRAATRRRPVDPGLLRHAPDMIQVDHVSKSFGSHCAVDDVSFRVAAARSLGFSAQMGREDDNSTILAGFVGASQGTVRILGDDITEQPSAPGRPIGYMPEASPLYPEMRVGEYLAFRAELKGVPRRSRREAIREFRRDPHRRCSVGADWSSVEGISPACGLADALVASTAGPDSR